MAIDRAAIGAAISAVVLLAASVPGQISSPTVDWSEIDAALADGQRAQSGFARCAGPKGALKDGPFEECARARTKVLRGLVEIGERLRAAGADPKVSGLRVRLEKLAARQKELETSYLLRNKASEERGAAAPSPYAGDWTFFYTPKAAAGACGSGAGYVGVEKSAGPFHVARTGRFLFISHEVSIAGSVDPSSGGISGILTDGTCGEGPISGRCSSPSRCSGEYSQSSPTAGAGASSGESGGFHLAR